MPSTNSAGLPGKGPFYPHHLTDNSSRSCISYPYFPLQVLKSYALSFPSMVIIFTNLDKMIPDLLQVIMNFLNIILYCKFNFGDVVNVGLKLLPNDMNYMIPKSLCGAIH